MARLLALALILLLAPTSAFGEEPPPEPRQTRLTYEWRYDAPIAMAGLLYWGLTEINKPNLASLECRYCRPNGADAAITRTLGWRNLTVANGFGDAFAYGVVPLTTVGLMFWGAAKEDALGEMPGNLLVMAEAVALSGALAQTVKFQVRRERPFVHELPRSEKLRVESPHDNNVSFYSAHANAAFAIAVSAGTVATIQDYKTKWWIWGVGLPVAGFTAYSRVAAKKHYFTDVLVGAAAGSAFGFAVPYFFHRAPRELQLSLAPMPDGALLAGRF